MKATEVGIEGKQIEYLQREENLPGEGIILKHAVTADEDEVIRGH